MTTTSLLCNVALIIYFCVFGLLIKHNTCKSLTVASIMVILFLLAKLTCSIIYKTEYNVSSNKIRNNYKILFISDIHFGGPQMKDNAINKIKAISNDGYDIVILGGDIVEECTSRKELNSLFETIGSIKSKYGIFYVYGNHDLQHETITKVKYDKGYLEDILNSYGITILEDNTITLNNEIILIGREDRNVDRKDIGSIYNDCNKDLYTIVIDHQPVDFEVVCDLGIDLQLSGHTHAGQVFPIGHYLNSVGAKCYGLYTDNDSFLIVSSGFGVGGAPIRTEQTCEYVVINLVSK